MALGICYLEQGLFELASKRFEALAERVPDNPDLYYYAALALTGGKRPGLLPMAKVKKMEEYLCAARGLDPTRIHVLVFLAMIKFDYYLKNGLRVLPPTVS